MSCLCVEIYVSLRRQSVKNSKWEGARRSTRKQWNSRISAGRNEDARVRVKKCFFFRGERRLNFGRARKNLKIQASLHLRQGIYSWPFASPSSPLLPSTIVSFSYFPFASAHSFVSNEENGQTQHGRVKQRERERKGGEWNKAWIQIVLHYK